MSVGSFILRMSTISGSSYIVPPIHIRLLIPMELMELSVNSCHWNIANIYLSMWDLSPKK
jgi:hypothetical protein